MGPRSIFSKFCRISHFLLFGGIIFLTAVSAPAQGRSSITGFVFTQERRALGQVPVELLNDVNQVLQRTRTDGSGRYFFTGLGSGRYTVRVLPIGTNLEEQSQDVEIVSLARPGAIVADQAVKDFYLRVRKSPGDGNAVVGTVFAQDIPDVARKLYEKGISSLNGNRREEGMQALLEAVEIFPEYYAALERLGTEYMRQKEYEVARAVFTKMVSVNQRSAGGWFGLASAAYGLSQFSVAAQAAEKAVELENDSYESHLLLGTSLRGLKNFAEAEKALLRAKALARGASSDVHWNLALLYGNDMGKFREAADELELYLKFVPPGKDIQNLKKLISNFRAKAASKKQ